MVSEDEMVPYMRQLIRREQDGERTAVQLGPYSALILIGVIQWATNQNRRFARHAPDMFERVLDQLKLMFVDDPIGETIIRQGEQPKGDQ